MCGTQSWCCQLKDERNCVLCVLDWFLSTFECVCMKKGEEVETKVNVSDAFLFSQRPRSLVAFQVGLPNRDRKSCFWISYKKVQRWKMSRFQETNTLMHLCLALGRLTIKFSHSTSFWSWSPQTRAQSSLPSWLPPSSLLLTLLKASHGDCCEDVGSLLRELPRWWDVALQYSRLWIGL